STRAGSTTCASAPCRWRARSARRPPARTSPSSRRARWPDSLSLRMPFSYFERLSPRQQKIYLQSDRVTEIRLARPALLLPLVEELRAGLASQDRRGLEAATQRLAVGP